MEAAVSLEDFGLRDLVGLNALSDENIARVAEAVRPFRLPPNANLHANLEQGWLIYLISGELVMHDDTGERYDSISAHTQRALEPVFRSGFGDYDVRASSQAELIRIDRLHVEVLLARQLSEATHVSEQAYEETDAEVFGSLLEAHESGELQVPSLPEVAAAVNEAVRDNDMDFNRLAAIIQRDPPFTARLIRVANSPAYRGAADVETLSAAIGRLGLDGARNLVMALAVEQLVKNVHPAARECLWDYYREASEVAALCFALATKTGSMREERAFMAGLLHGLGMVPIVNHAFEVLPDGTSAVMVERVAQHLVEPVSSWLLSEWGLDGQLCDAADDATNWYRAVDGEIAVIELVIAARLLRLVAKGEPAPAKIADADIGKALLAKGVDLSDPAEFLTEIEEQLETARQLLG